MRLWLALVCGFPLYAQSQPSAQLLLSPDGNTVYDPVNNITWLANFNLAATNPFGLATCKGPANQTCLNPSGSMHWNAAVAWVAAMNAASYLGQNNWQLPTTPPSDSNCAHTGPNGNSFGFGCTASALATLYSTSLRLQSPSTAVPIPGSTTGAFSNFQPYLYWTQGNAAANGYSTVSFNSGFQGANTGPNFLYVIPMIPGKITGAPAGSTIYDSTANVTWLANANIAATNTFGVPVCTSPTTPKLCVASDGAMSWDSARQFIANMNAAGYLGQKKWELPPGDPNCTGYNCSTTASPLDELYYGLLGLTAGTPVIPALPSTVGPFTNIQPYLYWSCQGASIQGPCSTDGPAANFEWTYSLGNGFTGTDLLSNMFYVAAYFPGPPAWYTPPAALVITTSAQLPTGAVGFAYSQSMAASGGVPPYSWTLVSGTLPDGLSLTPDGTISGTPTSAGSLSFSVQVIDSNSATATLAATLTIQAATTPPPPDISSISVCSVAAAGGQGSCPSGTQDTAQIVLAPGGGSINAYDQLMGISDEHQSVFPPGSLNGNTDYVFFVATSVKGGAPSTSLVALSGGSGPAANGQWTFDFPTSDGYGAYPNGVYNDIFTSSTANCPAVANAANQDTTFDQSYAAPGSILVDPTAPAGSLLMIYEGTNTCLGSTGGGKNNFYSSVGAATSLDYGHTWPTYRGTSTFNFVDLPGQNKNQGPNAPMGATGAGVCMGNSCTATPPNSYGRYPVLSPSISIATAAGTGQPLPNSMGDSEMSAFLDDASANPAQFVYVTYSYRPGSGALADPKAPGANLMIARGQLNGGTAPLTFFKWNGQAFAGAGLGGYDSAVFPAGPFSNCEGTNQLRFGSSISFVDTTQQYLLLFVCDSPGDPAVGVASGNGRGAAWFYSTSRNIADPTQWTAPQEIAGSWSAFDTSAGCADWTGFYPTAMSLGTKNGHLSSAGYIFYLWGCQTEATPLPGRQYSSRRFTMTLTGQSTPSPLAITAAAAQLPSGTVAAAYSQTLMATGGAPPYTWSLAAGSLPAGLTLTQAGAITGTPTAAGSSNFTVQVADSNSATATLAVTLVILPSSTPPPGTMSFYVSPAGNDAWSGTLAAPTVSGADGPFATFDAARAAVRALNKSGLTQVAVQFRGGTYYLPSTLQFAAADSGTAATPIMYQNFPGEAPVFSGGMPLTGWANVSGNKWTTTLPESTQYFENLFYNGVRRLRPRLGDGPLGTFYRIARTVYLNAPAPPAAAPDPNCSVYIAGSGWECFDRFQYDPKDPISGAWNILAPAKGNPCNQAPGNQAIAGDIEVLDFEQFSTSKLRVSCIDTTNHIVYLTGPTAITQIKPNEVGFIAGNRYLVENVKDQLTQPGQWFLDRSTTPWTLTYLANPGENPNTDSVVVPQVPQLLVASNLQSVTFQGLTFEHDNYVVPAAGHKSSEIEADIPGAVSFQNSQNITFDSGTVTQISGTGIEFISCVNKSSPSYCASNSATAFTANDVIQNSAFYDIGALGIRIGSPYTTADTDANVPQSMIVQNNVVEGYGRTIPASFGIGQGHGHDNQYTHNDVYDGYHCGISISMQAGFTTKPPGIGIANNTISFNHVYNLLQGIMNDGGSIRIDAGNNAYTAPGNKILNNRIHDVTDASIQDPNGYGGDGIYLDDQTGLVDVENNLVYRVSANAVYTPQGPAAPNEANIVKNNILAYARSSILSINLPYPYGVPAAANQNFVFTNNLVYFDRDNTSSPKFWVQGGCVYSAGFPYTQFQLFSSNLYWRTDGAFASDKKAFYVQPNAETGPDAPCTGNTNAYTFYTFAGWQQQVGEDLQSVIQNPGFNNPAYPADDYSLPTGSPGVGFVLFDPAQAGRLNPIFMPPPVPATFPTKLFNPATDY